MSSVSAAPDIVSQRIRAEAVNRQEPPSRRTTMSDAEFLRKVATTEATEYNIEAADRLKAIADKLERLKGLSAEWALRAAENRANDSLQRARRFTIDCKVLEDCAADLDAVLKENNDE